MLFISDEICDLDLSIRARNICSFNDICTVSQLLELGPTRFSVFRNCGVKTLAEIQRFLKDNDIDWEDKN